VRLLRPGVSSRARRARSSSWGFQPRWVETGYGYIEFPEGVTPGVRDVALVRSFREKPDAATAATIHRRGELLLERRNVLLADLGIVGRTASVSPQNGQPPGGPAPSRKPRFSRPTQSRLPEVREHLHRFRRARARLQRGRSGGRRHRLERRRELERRSTSWIAAMATAMPRARPSWPSPPPGITSTLAKSWLRWLA
jgi:hypothetical protein